MGRNKLLLWSIYASFFENSMNLDISFLETNEKFLFRLICKFFIFSEYVDMRKLGHLVFIIGNIQTVFRWDFRWDFLKSAAFTVNSRQIIIT